MANGRRKGNNNGKRTRDAATYRHPEAESLLRPEVGTQAQFRKRKPPARYRYDSSIAPALEWDGQNSAREAGVQVKSRSREMEPRQQVDR